MSVEEMKVKTPEIKDPSKVTKVERFPRKDSTKPNQILVPDYTGWTVGEAVWHAKPAEIVIFKSQPSMLYREVTQGDLDKLILVNHHTTPPGSWVDEGGMIGVVIVSALDRK